MEMEISRLLFRIVRSIEEKFDGVIAYGYTDKRFQNVVCISDLDVYFSKEFRSVADSWRKVMRAKNQRITFFYCIPIEKELEALAKNENLVLNV